MLPVLPSAVYAIGGDNATVRQKSAEVYDPKKNKWTAIADMATERAGAQAVAIDGQIYVAGGVNAEAVALDSIEVFDPKAGKWSLAPGPLPKASYEFGLTALVPSPKGG